MTFGFVYANCPANAEIIRDYHPSAILGYNSLGFTTKMMYPTILSAYKAGLLGNRIPLLAFKIEVVHPSLSYPVLCTVDPSSQTWYQEACDQAGKIFKLPSAGILTEDGQPLCALGLDRLWTTRQTAVYRAETVKTTVMMNSMASSEMFSVRKRATTAEGHYTDEYVKIAATAIEERLAEKLSELLQECDPSEWLQIITNLRSQQAALQFVNLVVNDESFVHAYDGHCFSQVLVNCGFHTPLIFVRRLAHLFTSSLGCVYSMLMNTRQKIQHKMMMTRFCAQLRAYHLGRWMRNVRDSSIQYYPAGAVSYSSSSSDEESDPVIFERPVSLQSAISDPTSKIVFLGEGIDGQEEIGALRLSNVVGPRAVQFRLLRRDTFVKRFPKVGNVTFDPKRDKNLFQKFSPTGRTLVEPGDLITVTIRKASSEPIDPVKKRTSRSMAMLRRAGRRVRRSLSPSSSSKKAPAREDAPAQYVRLDWVMYSKSSVRKDAGKGFEWKIVSSYRLRRGMEDYDGPGFVVPLQAKNIRYAVFIYQNALGTDNQWIYQGMRVFDSVKEGVSKTKRTVMFDRQAFAKYKGSVHKNNPFKFTEELSRARYVSYPPFLRRNGKEGPIEGVFPVFVGDPKKRVPVSDCIMSAWAMYEHQLIESGNNTRMYWLNFANNNVYPKMRRIANVVYQLAGEKAPYPNESTYNGLYGQDEEDAAPVLSPQECASSQNVNKQPELELPEEPIPTDYPSSESDSGSSSDNEPSPPASSKQLPPPALPRNPVSLPEMTDNSWTKNEYTLGADGQGTDFDGNPVTWKKGQMVQIFANVSDPSLVHLYRGEDGVQFLAPRSSILEPLPEGWPLVFVGNSIGAKMTAPSNYLAYEATLRRKAEQRDNVSSKQRVEDFSRLVSIGCGLRDKIRNARAKKGKSAGENIQCGIYDEKKKHSGDKKGAPATPLQEDIAANHIVEKKKSLKILSPDKKKLFVVKIKKNTTYADVKERVEKEGFPNADFVLVKMDMTVPSDDTLISSLGEHEMTLLPRGYYENLVIGDAIGAALNAATSCDAASFVGKHMHSGKSEKHSVKFAHPQSTSYYSSNPHNIISETRSTMVLSSIETPVSPIGLDRNVMHETPISTDHVLARCKMIAQRRNMRKDTTDYTSTLMKLELAFDFLHCTNTDRVRIFRRTVNGSCHEGLFAALRMKELVAIGEVFDSQNPKVPAMAYDANALYFFRTAFSPIDNEAIFETVLDNPDRFIDALGFVVTQKDLPDQATMNQIAEACYLRRFPPAEKTLPPPPINRCTWDTLWRQIIERRRNYELPAAAHDEDLEPRGVRLPNETYGALQGFPTSTAIIGNDVDGKDDDPESEEDTRGDFSGGGLDVGGFDGDLSSTPSTSSVSYPSTLTPSRPSPSSRPLPPSSLPKPSPQTPSSGFEGAKSGGFGESTGGDYWGFPEESEEDGFGGLPVPEPLMEEQKAKEKESRKYWGKYNEEKAAEAAAKTKTQTSTPLQEVQTSPSVSYPSTLTPSRPSPSSRPLPPSSLPKPSPQTPSSGFEGAKSGGFGESTDGDDFGFPDGTGGETEDFTTPGPQTEEQKAEAEAYSKKMREQWLASLKFAEKPKKVTEVQPSPPVKASTPLREAQTGIPTVRTPEVKPSYPAVLVVVFNGERFVYDPLNKLGEKGPNVSTRVIAKSDMNLSQVLIAFANDLNVNYGIQANADCMVVRVEDANSPDLSPEVYEYMYLFKRASATESPQVVLFINDGHTRNYRENVTKSSEPEASSSIMSELLDMTVPEVAAPASIGSCLFLEEEHKNFNMFWKTAVADQSGVFFKTCPAHTAPIFTPGVEHVVVVPHPSIFQRFCVLFKERKMQFREFIRSHTFALPSGFQSCRRTQVVSSMDGTHKVNIKYKFKPALNQHCLRVNGAWSPIRQLNMGEGREDYNIYALPYAHQL